MNEQYAWLYEDPEDRIRAVDKLLGRPLALRKEISLKETKIRILREAAGRFEIRMHPDKVKSTPDPTRIQDVLARVVDEEREIRRLEAEQAQAYLVSAGYIADISHPLVQRVMELYYLEGRDVTHISADLGYSVSHLFRLRRRGLEEVEERLRGQAGMANSEFTIQK
jgi:hypothetical protein